MLEHGGGPCAPGTFTTGPATSRDTWQDGIRVRCTAMVPRSRAGSHWNHGDQRKSDRGGPISTGNLPPKDKNQRSTELMGADFDNSRPSDNSADWVGGSYHRSRPESALHAGTTRPPSPSRRRSTRAASASRPRSRRRHRLDGFSWNERSKLGVGKPLRLGGLVVRLLGHKANVRGKAPYAARTLGAFPIWPAAVCHYGVGGSRPSTNTGEWRSAVDPSPICPYPLNPQQYASLVSVAPQE
jgi:hypothetical protein